MPGDRAAFSVVSCGACPGTTTSDFGHVHHVVPRAAGGERGPTIWLCSNCHGMVHRIAEAIIGNRLARCLDQIQMLFPGGQGAATRDRLFKLGQEAASAIMEARGRPAGPEERMNVSFKLSRELHAAAVRALTGTMDSETGRAVGVPGLARQLLIAWLQDRGAI